jgi:hypothetical protein
LRAKLVPSVSSFDRVGIPVAATSSFMTATAASIEAAASATKRTACRVSFPSAARNEWLRCRWKATAAPTTRAATIAAPSGPPPHRTTASHAAQSAARPPAAERKYRAKPRIAPMSTFGILRTPLPPFSLGCRGVHGLSKDRMGCYRIPRK